MTAVTTWYTYPAQPLSPLIYLLWDSFVSMAKHMEFLLNYKISCSDTITCTSHMGLGTKHDSYNYWYSTKQCIKKKTAISSITGGGGGRDLCMVSIHGSLHPNTKGRTLGPHRHGVHHCNYASLYVSHLIIFFLVVIKNRPE